MASSRYLRSVTWLALFAVAMAYLEAAVVVYLRAIYYPEGFAFPLVDMGALVYLVEIGREIATVVMLWAVAHLTGASRYDRLARFAYLFGVWDIGYYLWLKVTLDWPGSLFDWDVLFLIPIAWIGPVLAPVLVALLMIAGGAWAMRSECIRMDRWSWVGGLIGCGLGLYAFMEDIGRALGAGGAEAVGAFIPTHFNWAIFALGYLFMLAATGRVILKSISP